MLCPYGAVRRSTHDHRSAARDYPSGDADRSALPQSRGSRAIPIGPAHGGGPSVMIAIRRLRVRRSALKARASEAGKIGNARVHPTSLLPARTRNGRIGGSLSSSPLIAGRTVSGLKMAASSVALWPQFKRLNHVG